MNTFQRAALAYRELGFNVIPLKPRSKEPLVSWRKFQSVRVTEDLILKWWARHPNANIALLTGEVSKNLVVLDIDPRNGGRESIQGKPLPITPCVETGGGGWHYYFVSGNPPHGAVLAPGLDLKGNGGLIAAPPSIHPSGNPYKWAEGLKLGKVERHALPDWIIELIPKKGKKKQTEARDGRQRDDLKIIADLLNPYWLEGQRNYLNLSLCGFLAKTGWSWEQAAELIAALSVDDPEAAQRIEGLRATYLKFESGEEVQGYAGLSEILPTETLNELHSLVRNAGRSSVRVAISIIRELKHVPPPEKREQIAEIVRKTLQKDHGDFLLTEGPRHYFFDRNSKAVFPVNGQDMTALLDMEFGLNPNEMETRCTIDHLASFTHRQGKKAEIFRICHYAKSLQTLYINMGGGRLARLDGSNVTLADNGTDNVLFMDTMDPIAPDMEADVNLRQKLLDGVNFTTAIPQPLQEVLCWSWFRTFFFFSLLSSRPILAIIGPKGAGKTFLLKVWLRLLYGSKRTEPDSITKEDAFEAAMAANYFLALDNVDNNLDWLNDALAKAATGQMIRKRELYTTIDEIVITPRCLLAINSRTPQFKREDVSDRLLIIRLDRLPQGQFYREDVLLAPFLGIHRDRIWGALLKELNVCVRQLRSCPLPEKTEHRLADWETLACALAAKDGEVEKLKFAMKMMEDERINFVLEDDSFVPSIPRIADGKWRTAKQIWDAIGGKESAFKVPDPSPPI